MGYGSDHILQAIVTGIPIQFLRNQSFLVDFQPVSIL